MMDGRRIFFIGFYEVIEEDLMRVIEESKGNGRVLATFNSTIVSLIPKLDKSSYFE
jgi:hypothetical protein